MNQQSTVTFDLPPLPDAQPDEPQARTRGIVPTGTQAIVGDNGEIIGPNPRPGDEKLYVVFYQKTVPDGLRTREEGRPIYKDVDYIRIHVPGDKNTVIDKKVSNEERSRFFAKYQHYKMTQTNKGPDGTPLMEWPAITRAQAEELKHFNVYTVEQLATLPDQFGQRFMGFFELRRRAQAFLAQAKDDAFAAKMAVENDELRAQLKQQGEALAAMSARMSAMEAAAGAAKEPANVHDAVAGRTGRK